MLGIENGKASQTGSMKIAVTGANGFIGRALCSELFLRGLPVRALVRKTSTDTRYEATVVGDMASDLDWTRALAGIDCVIHCAARAHVLSETAANPLDAFRAVNLLATQRLAKQAAMMGVRRLIYLSSIGVLGVGTNGRPPFSVRDTPDPPENYGISKWEAEQALWEIAQSTGLEVVVVRPPLVYGPGVRANFLRLMQLVAKGVPLPFGKVDNSRSLIGVENLVDLIIRCIDHPAATGQTFLVSDGQDISTKDLILELARMMGRPARLLSLPRGWVRFAAWGVGRLPEVDRLMDSLCVDIRHTCEILDWPPPVSLQTGLQRTVDAFLANRTKTLRSPN
jgi:nucleoside-diphosphate-sugar epimerase